MLFVLVGWIPTSLKKLSQYVGKKTKMWAFCKSPETDSTILSDVLKSRQVTCLKITRIQ